MVLHVSGKIIICNPETFSLLSLLRNQTMIAALFQLSELDPSKLYCCFDSNMQNIIMPVIEGGISRYFEIFPHAVHSAKRTLKEYLNASDV